MREEGNERAGLGSCPSADSTPVAHFLTEKRPSPPPLFPTFPVGATGSQHRRGPPENAATL